MENNVSKMEVSKQFSCAKDKLFAAWTSPEQLKQWWKPLGKQLEEVTNELDEGGNIKYVFDGNSLTIDGKYDKVDENNLLEYSWNWHVTSEPVEDAEYKLSVRFEGTGDSSALYVTQTGFAKEQSIDPHKKGWEQALEQLNDFVSNQENNTTNNDDKQKAPVTGYNETPEQQKVGGG